MSPEILDELVSTFAGSYFRRGLSPDQIERAHGLLQAEAELAVVTKRVSGVASHPEDDQILAAAVSAQADYLVTGDVQLQQLGAYVGVIILPPRAFLDLLGGGLS